MNTTKKEKIIFPIRFARLHNGSDFRIFAEPSRDIRKSNDPTIYTKVCDAWSEEKGNAERCIILYPEDLVQPLSRGQA